MTAPTLKNKIVFNALRLTKRDLRLFVFATVLFSSAAAGAVSLTQHAPTADAHVCSAAKYFH